MYYIWEHDDFDFSNLFIANISEKNPWKKYYFQYFNRIDVVRNEIPNVPFELVIGRHNKKLIFNDYIFVPYLGLKLVNEKLKKILDELKINNLQFFPVIIKYQSLKKYISGYYIINCCNYISSIDLENSIYKKNIKGSLYSFRKLILNDNNIPNDTKLFIPENTNLYIIHENLKNIFEKEKISGIKFNQINNK